ncbi:MAG: enoyl-CoA hydratase/isomerase family protein [Chitinophagales bacterium]
MSNLLTNTDENGILTISINREKKLNALNASVIQEIGEVLRANADDFAIKGVILTGVGKKAFAAGADISEFASFNGEQGQALSESGMKVFGYIENYNKPVIAAVNGYALGGGCELCMSCHLRIASENARFGQPEVKLGLTPGYGGTQRLVQLIGKGKALELLLTTDMIKASEALQLGLVNHVVPQEELMDKCREILKKITRNAPIAIAKTIQAVNAHFEDGVDGFQTEAKMFGECFDTADFKEGTDAFLNKRRAVFTGK